MSHDHQASHSGRRRNNHRRRGPRQDNYRQDRQDSRRQDNRSFESVSRSEARRPELTFGQKVLKVLSFGLWSPSPKRPAQPPRQLKGPQNGRPAAPASKLREEKAPRPPRPDRPVRDERMGEGDQRPPREARQARPPREPREPREPRSAPSPAEVTGPRLHVGNLNYDTTESDLFDHFSSAGKVRNCEVVRHARTQKSKGFAFVEMQTPEEAKKAAAELQDKELMGRKLTIGGARSVRDDRSPAKAESNQDSSEVAEADTSQESPSEIPSEAKAPETAAA